MSAYVQPRGGPYLHTKTPGNFIFWVSVYRLTLEVNQSCNIVLGEYTTLIRTTNDKPRLF